MCVCVCVCVRVCVVCRVCNRLSGSNMDLEGQQGSVENLSQSLRGLNCCSNASSDSLQALSDTGELHTDTLFVYLFILFFYYLLICLFFDLFLKKNFFFFFI